MASKKAIATVIMTIKTVYSYYAKDNDIKILAQIWEKALNPYDDNSVDKALLLSLRESKMPPTPADIIEKIESLNPKFDKYLLWNEFVTACEKINYLSQSFGFTYINEKTGKTQGQEALENAKNIYNNLSEPIRNYTGSFREMIRISSQYEKDDFKYEKNRFMKDIVNLINQTNNKILLSDIQHGEFLEENKK